MPGPSWETGVFAPPGIPECYNLWALLLGLTFFSFKHYDKTEVHNYPKFWT